MSKTSIPMRGLFLRGAKPKLKKPMLLMGLPGIGFVGKMAADHIARELGAKRFADLVSPHFPNQVIALRSGRLRPFALRFYEAHLPSGDYVILRGDIQPLSIEGQYEVTSRVLSFFASLGGVDAIALAGYATERRGEAPKVYACSTSKALFEQLVALGAEAMPTIIPIIGMAGLVPGLAGFYGLRGACILVETSGAIDAIGAKALVDFVSKLLKREISTINLEERARRISALISKMERRMAIEERRARAAIGIPPVAKPETIGYV